MPDFETTLEKDIWDMAHKFNGLLRHPVPDQALRYLMEQVHELCENHLNRESIRLQEYFRKSFINEKISTEK